jgi:hypothetical protein
MLELVHELYSTWEGIERLLFNIFAGLSEGSWAQSQAIFYSHLNHRSRREMLEALAQVVFLNEPDRLKELLNLMVRVKKAARKRNEVAHGEWATVTETGEYRRLPIKLDPRGDKHEEWNEHELKQRVDYLNLLAKDLLSYVLLTAQIGRDAAGIVQAP